ncbi:hypothetical protein DFP72DRAFT_1071472 [Ephemerocybe angulata]|uniref:F-box domain-containing protein n=1 Tax=Ephemerocybe angulata TaxID=980116 RepID=A0A8H6HR98_9AGAR|nr:hypothetical protein DFP72DRAFT_1071472 [Tulosesus angulatus]
MATEPFCRECRFYHAPSRIYDLHNDILHEILSYLPLSALAQLQRTSAHFAVLLAVKTHDSVDNLLQSFGLGNSEASSIATTANLEAHDEYDGAEDELTANTAVDFMETLRDCSSILVGLAPLRVLFPGIPQQRRLEIFCSWTDQYMVEALEERGYRKKEVLERCQVFKVLGYERNFGNPNTIGSACVMAKTVGEGDRKEILLVGCKGVTPVSLLTESPCTLLMTFISGEGLYCLYPRLASDSSGYFNLPDDDYVAWPGDIPVVNTLRDAGFLIEDAVEKIVAGHRCMVCSSCPSSIRTFPSPSDFAIEFNIVPHWKSMDTRSLASTIWRLKSCWTCPGLSQLMGFHSEILPGAKIQGVKTRIPYIFS